MNNSTKKNIIDIVITILFFILSSIFCNKFILDDVSYKPILFVYLKVTFIIILFFLIKQFHEFIIKIREGNNYYKRILKYWIIAFVILMFWLLIVWPGVWSWDEFYILDYTTNLMYSTWQSYLTVMFYSYCLMLWFNPMSIVIVQIIFISFVIGYLTANIHEKLKNKKLVWLMYIPLFLPAIICNNLYPLRLTMYSYIELLLLFTIIKAYTNKESFSFLKILLITILSFIVMKWRSEAIFYILFFPFLFFTIFNKKKYGVLFIVSIIIVLIAYSPVKYYQDKMDKETQYTYKLTAVINPLSMMLQENLKGDYEKNLALINKVLNVESMKNNPSYVEIPSYWAGNIKQKDFVKNFKSLYKGYFSLVKDNPMLFLKVRLLTFMSTNGFDSNKTIIINDFKSRRATDTMYYEELEESVFSYKLRNRTLDFLSGFTNGKKNKVFTIIFWDIIPPVVFMIVLTILLTIKKKWVLVITTLFVLARVPLIFLTASANYFMYYYPTYLVSIYTIVFIIIKALDKNKKIIKRKR